MRTRGVFLKPGFTGFEFLKPGYPGTRVLAGYSDFGITIVRRSARQVSSTSRIYSESTVFFISNKNLFLFRRLPLQNINGMFCLQVIMKTLCRPSAYFQACLAFLTLRRLLIAISDKMFPYTTLQSCWP